ncbi:hypothetical protein FGB62_96g13 [Gracilaria domingensis]|nr:hypothetical protein FGB62_96g13 [Gracilaria domingensis]
MADALALYTGQNCNLIRTFESSGAFTLPGLVDCLRLPEGAIWDTARATSTRRIHLQRGPHVPNRRHGDAPVDQHHPSAHRAGHGVRAQHGRHAHRVAPPQPHGRRVPPGARGPGARHQRQPAAAEHGWPRRAERRAAKVRVRGRRVRTHRVFARRGRHGSGGLFRWTERRALFASRLQRSSVRLRVGEGNLYELDRFDKENNVTIWHVVNGERLARGCTKRGDCGSGKVADEHGRKEGRGSRGRRPRALVFGRVPGKTDNKLERRCPSLRVSMNVNLATPHYKLITLSGVGAHTAAGRGDRGK